MFSTAWEIKKKYSTIKPQIVPVLFPVYPLVLFFFFA